MGIAIWHERICLFKSLRIKKRYKAPIYPLLTFSTSTTKIFYLSQPPLFKLILTMPSLNSLFLITLFSLAFTSAIPIPTPQDPDDPSEPLPTFPGDGISYLENGATGIITSITYSGGPAYGCLDATGHVTKSTSSCAVYTATTVENSTYGAILSTSNGNCGFNPDNGWKFGCTGVGTSFYVSL